MHSTNYTDTFIVVADDCPEEAGVTPPARKNPTVAARTFEAIASQPYTLQSDDVIFGVYADRKEIPAGERAEERQAFFSKGQACLRASDLGRRYGWGVHHDSEGRVAVYGRETARYAELASGRGPEGEVVKVVKAMRRSR